MIILGVLICLSNMGSLLLVLLVTMASVGAEGLDPCAHQNFCVADLKSQAPLPVSLRSMASSISTFNGTNFLDWSEQVQFHLSALDLDLALRSKKPTGVTHESTVEEKASLRTWERSNRLSIMFMRMTIDNKIKSTLPEARDAKEYLKLVEERFRRANKSKVGKLIAKLTTMKFDGNRGIHEHLLEMTNLATRLKTFGMNVDETFLVQFIQNSLPPPLYRRLQVHRNTEKMWNMNELVSMLVQNEARLKQQGIHSLSFVISHEVGMSEKKSKKDRNKNLLKVAEASRNVEKHNGPKCKPCRKYGRIQKDFLKQREGFEKKDRPVVHIAGTLHNPQFKST